MSEYLVNYNIITLYPTMAYVVYLFCKKYYKCMLELHTYYGYPDSNTLLTSNELFKQFDIYDNTDDYKPMNKKTCVKETQTQYESEYYNNVLFAFNQIPT
jgi:hypothetical protein